MILLQGLIDKTTDEFFLVKKINEIASIFFYHKQDVPQGQFFSRLIDWF